MVWCLLVLEPVVVVPPLETTFLVLETFKVEVEEEVRDFAAPAALVVAGGGGGGGGGVGAVAAKALLLSLPADGPFMVVFQVIDWLLVKRRREKSQS